MANVKIGEVKLPGNEEENKPYWQEPTQLKDTVAGMISADYRERFKAEYLQLKLRAEKLERFIARIEAAKSTAEYDCEVFAVEMPEHDCPVKLLKEQSDAMREYLRILRIRAVIERIELE